MCHFKQYVYIPYQDRKATWAQLLESTDHSFGPTLLAYISPMLSLLIGLMPDQHATIHTKILNHGRLLSLM